ncbi:MAG: hypothetical protein FD127_4178, partial [Acidimicrobiaceae bacterium]
MNGGLLEGQLWMCDDTRLLQEGVGPPWFPAIGTGAAQIPNTPLSDLLIHPDEPEVMFVSTEFGLMVTSDRAQTWSFVSGAPERISRLALRGKDTLFAFTRGRGLQS